MSEILLVNGTQRHNRREPFLAFFTTSNGAFAFPSPVTFASAKEARIASVAFAEQRLGWKAGEFVINDQL